MSYVSNVNSFAVNADGRNSSIGPEAARSARAELRRHTSLFVIDADSRNAPQAGTGRISYAPECTLTLGKSTNRSLTKVGEINATIFM